MSLTEAQAALIEAQKQLAEEGLAEEGEATPNADELFIAASDGVQKALDAVEKLLHKLG